MDTSNTLNIFSDDRMWTVKAGSPTRVGTPKHTHMQLTRVATTRLLSWCCAACVGLGDVDVSRGLALPAHAAPSSTLAENAPSTTASARVTKRVFVDVRVIQSFTPESGVLEDAAVRGRLTFGLFGENSPKGVAKFLSFTTGNIGQFTEGDGPSYRTGSFERLQPGRLLEGGRINGLKQIEFAGTLEYSFGSRLLPLSPILEANDLRHDARGLLTRRIFDAGPEFSVTLSPTPSLDGDYEVLGRLEEGAENEAVLKLLEGLPYITGRSLEEPGSAPDQVFNAQKAFFTTVAKGIGDQRATDRTGQLLRRVEIVNCGVL